MPIYIDEMPSVIGRLTLVSTERGLCYIGFPGGKKNLRSFVDKHFAGIPVKSGGSINKRAAKQIETFLKGKTNKFDIPLDLKVSGFNRRALMKVKRIPYGKVRTYKEIAAALGNPGAARAVGNANRLNPLPIVIPCHRVVAAAGLGGYGGGLGLKKKLLVLEQEHRKS